MNPNNERKIKAQTMGSIMRHQKLSRTFSDAVSAPIGSTKRKQAQSMLSVMNKVNQRNMPMGPMPIGGTGGPGGFIGPMPQATPTSTPPTAPVSPSNRLIFNSAPLPKSELRQYKEPSKIIETPGLLSGLPSAYKKFSEAGQTASMGAVIAPLAVGQYAVDNLGYGMERMARGIFGSKTNSDTGKTWNNLVGDENSPFKEYRPLSETWGMQAFANARPGEQMQNTAAGVHSQAQGQQPLPSGSGAVLNVDENGTPIGMKSSDVTNGSTLGAEDSTHQPPGVNTSTQQSSGSAIKTAGSTIGGVPNMMGPRDVQDAVNKNMGPAAFAFNAMADKELLKRLFPGVPEDQLPMGASLTEQVGKLQDVVRKDLNMDLIENSLANKIKAGTNLTGDLNAYIRGRDEMINNLDGMINDFESKAYTADALRDPETANTMKTYGNYLYTLKGRAAQRYVDFANESINQFNSELKGLEGLYSQKMSEFETVYNQRATMTQETYNRTYAMLTDLYNNVEQAPAKALNMATMQAQLYAANATIADAAGGSVGLGQYSGDDYIKGANFWKNQMVDKNGDLIKGVSLDDYIAQASNANIPVNAAIDTYVNGLAAELEKNTSDPKKFSDTLKYVNSTLNGDILSTIASRYPGSSAGGAYKTMVPKINGSIAKHVLSNFDLYKEAIGDIAPSNWRGARKIKDKATWMSRHPDVSQSVLSNAYDSLMSYAGAASPSGVPSPTAPVIVGLDDKELNEPEKFASHIANLISPMVQ